MKNEHPPPDFNPFENVFLDTSSSTAFHRVDVLLEREDGWHKHRRINFFPAGRRDVGKQKAVEPRPKGRRNAARRDVSEREAARGLEGRAPSDTATATTAGATAGPGETLNSLQGRTGNEHRFVCSRNERTLRAPCAAVAAWRPRAHCLPSGALSPLPGGPRGKRSRRVEEERRGRAGSTGAASLVTRPGNVTRSFIRSTPLACTRPSPIIRAATR